MRRIEKERKKDRWIIAIHEHKKKMHEGSNHLEKKRARCSEEQRFNLTCMEGINPISSLSREMLTFSRLNKHNWIFDNFGI